MSDSQAKSEIIFASTSEIIGQGQPASHPFSYGSFILAGKRAQAVGIVYNVETASADPNRNFVAIGLPEDEFEKSYPNIKQLIRPQIKALLIGRMNQVFEFGLPSTPPPIHGEIVPCTAEQIQLIAKQLGFLRLMFTSGKSSMEELIVSACLHLLGAFEGEPENQHRQAVRVGKAVSDLYRDNYDALRRILERIETWLA